MQCTYSTSCCLSWYPELLTCSCCVLRQLWYHVIGTPQEQDRFIYAIPEEPEWMIGAEVTDDGMCGPTLPAQPACVTLLSSVGVKTLRDPINRLIVTPRATTAFAGTVAARCRCSVFVFISVLV